MYSRQKAGFCQLGVEGGGGFNLHLRACSFTIELGWMVFFEFSVFVEIGFGVSLSRVYHKCSLMKGGGENSIGVVSCGPP